MLRFLSNCFEKALGFFAWVILITSTILWGNFGYYFGTLLSEWNHDYRVIFTLLGIVVGVLMGLILDTCTFGFFGQIIAIKDSLRKMEKQLKYQGKDVEKIAASTAPEQENEPKSDIHYEGDVLSRLSDMKPLGSE